MVPRSKKDAAASVAASDLPSGSEKWMHQQAWPAPDRPFVIGATRRTSPEDNNERMQQQNFVVYNLIEWCYGENNKQNKGIETVKRKQ